MNQPSWGRRFMRLPHGGDIACPQVRDYKESTRSHHAWTVGWRDLLCQKGVCFLKNLRMPYSAPLETQLVGFWKAVLVSLKCCQQVATQDNCLGDPPAGTPALSAECSRHRLHSRCNYAIKPKEDFATTARSPFSKGQKHNKSCCCS